MKISLSFLNYICENYKEDFAFDVYLNFFSNQEVPYNVFMDKLNELIDLPENQNRWTIFDRIPYMPQAIMFNSNTFEYTNKYFTIDGLLFNNIEAAKQHALQKVNNIDPVNLCVVNMVDKNDDIWVHKSTIFSTEDLNNFSLIDELNQWFSIYNPQNGEINYIQGKQNLVNEIVNLRNIEAKRRMLYKIFQQIKDIEDGFTADIEILDGPY